MPLEPIYHSILLGGFGRRTTYVCNSTLANTSPVFPFSDAYGLARHFPSPTLIVTFACVVLLFVGNFHHGQCYTGRQESEHRLLIWLDSRRKAY